MKVETVIIGDYGKGCGNGNMEEWENRIETLVELGPVVQVENGDVESVICNSRW